MQKNLLFFLAILIISCSNKPTKGVLQPDEIGKYTFLLLKNISTISKDEFMSKLLSVEEIRIMGQNKDLIPDSEVRNELTSLERSEVEGDRMNNYNELKTSGAENGLKWTEIKYLDYVYEVDEEDGLDFYTGKLYFEEGKKRCSVNLTSLYDGNVYQLIHIEDIEITNED